MPRLPRLLLGLLIALPLFAIPPAALDLDGQPTDPLACSATQTTPKAIVLYFTATECPIANRCTPRLNALAETFAPQGVAFFSIYADPSTTLAQIRQHRADYALSIPALRDPDHSLVVRSGATVTPEVAVYLPATSTEPARLIYRGRIDDQFTAFGKSRPEPTQHDLRDLLTALLEGKTPPTLVTTKAIGCYIPEKK